MCKFEKLKFITIILFLNLNSVKNQNEIIPICLNIKSPPLSLVCKSVDVPYYKNNKLLDISKLDPNKYSFYDNITHSNLQAKKIDKNETGIAVYTVKSEISGRIDCQFDIGLYGKQCGLI